MKTLHYLSTFALLTALASIAPTKPVLAKAAPTQDESGADVQVLQSLAVVHVQANGAFTEQDTQVIQALTRIGANSMNPFTMDYSKSMATMKVQSAYIIKANGKRVDIPATEIAERPAPAPSGADSAPEYDDQMVVSITLPGFNKGDKLYVQTLLTQFKPMFPQQYSDMWGPAVDETMLKQSVTVYAPTSMKLNAAQRGGWRIAHHTDGNTQIFTAILPAYQAQFPGTSTVASSDYTPVFEVSSFPTWASVGAAYWARAQAQAQVTPLVKQVADEVAGKLTRLDAVKALYNWESEHIHYIGLELGVGGYVPISATTTLTTGYGDCKQHSTLLEALLAARGIEADPVLINWDNSFTLPPLPGPSFNHAIDYLPQYHLFLDSTGEFETFGQLAIGERDKQVVVAGPKPFLTRTPGAQPDQNKLVYNATLHLADDGTLTGTADVTTTGWWAWFYRQIFSEIPPAAYGRVMSMLLAPSGGGSGTFHPGNPTLLEQPMQVAAQWSTPAYALPGKTLSVPLPAGPYLVQNSNPISALTAVAGPPTRQHDVVTYYGEVDWRSTLTLPSGYAPTYLPPDETVQNTAGRYSYTLRDTNGTITASYQLKLNQIVYTPAQYGALRALLIACLRDQSAPLVFHRI